MKKTLLFCVPYAGASANIYWKWSAKLDELIYLVPLELAGRGSRVSEPHYNTFDEIISDLGGQIHKYLKNNEAYALFGHSFGGTIVYEVGHYLTNLGVRSPEAIFFSGKSAPGNYPRNRFIHSLPEDQFKAEIFRYGITPKEVFETKELYEYFMPILKNDIQMSESYVCKDRQKKLDCPFFVLYGKDDVGVRKKQISDWSLFTNRTCSFFGFNGGHFFIREFEDEIIGLINRTLTKNEVVQ